MDIFKFNIKKNINEKEYFKNGSIILLGEFETFHKGHKKLLDQAKKIQKNEKIGILLIEKNKSTFQTVENRLINLASLGFDFVVFVEFNFEFMSIEGNDFISYLDKNFNIKNYIVGKDFKFGKNRKFSSSDIKNLTNANLYVIDILKIGNVKVSSSEIKRMHEFGEYNLIKELVINPLVFDITIYDKKIKWEQKIEIPQFGNYFFSILIDDFWYHGLINFSIGSKINYHLINFDKKNNLFNQKSKIKIFDVQRIIVNQRFNKITDKDIEQAKKYFSI